MASQRKAGAVLGYANIVVKNVVNLLYTPMLLAFVGQGDYGVFQTANNFIVSLQLLTFGFSGAYVRFYMQRATAGDEEGVRKLNGMYLLLYLGVCAVAIVLGLVFASSCASLFSASFTPDEIGLAGVVMTVLTFNVATTLLSTVFDAFIIAHERFAFQQTRQMFTSLATPGLALCLLVAGMGVVGVAIAQLSVNLLLLALNARYAIGKLGMRFELRGLDGTLFKSVAAFSGWIFLNQICDIVNQNLPNALLGMTTSAAAVAVFAIAVQIRQVFTSLSVTLSNVFRPKINRIVAESDDNEVLTDLMSRVGRYQMILFCWVYGGFVILGRFFVTAWAGEGFSEAYWLVLIMVAPLAISLTQNTGIEIQRAKNRHRARSLVYIVMAFVNVAITVSLSGLIGYWAAVAGYIVYVLIGCGVFMNWYYQARIGLDMARFWKVVLPTMVCGVLSTFICLLGTIAFPVNEWATFVIWGLVYTLVYSIVFLLFAATADEKTVAKNAIRKTLNRAR